MRLINLGIRYPITTIMFFSALILVGLFSYRQLGLDLMPELELPTIAVTTYYPGASPQEVESDITEPLEEYLATVSDLDKLESVSQEGVSLIMLKFKWGTNLDEAANDIRDKIDLAKKGLPEDAEDPIIFKFNLAMFPIFVLGVTAEKSLSELYDIADDYICDKLEAIPGIASAIIRGGYKRQLNIYLNLNKLNGYNISPETVAKAIQNANLSLPAGHLKVGQLDYLLRVPEKLKLAEVGEILIKKIGEKKVYLKDIANIDFGFEEAQREVKVNGRKGMIILVQKRSGENTVEVVRRLRKKLKEIEKTLPPDVKLFVIRDFAEFVETTIKNLRTSLLWGGVLVSSLILFFLGSISSSLIVLTALPACLIIAFFLLYLADYTLNIISLSSLAIALGMVVDGAIVVIDNIFRKKEMGLPPILASQEGSSEVAKPVIASVLTTIVVFFPVLFIGGIPGILFKQMAYVITLTLMISLLNALWLIPMLSSKLKKEHTPKIIKEKYLNYGKSLVNSLECIYEKALRKVLHKPKKFLLLITACLLLSIFLFHFIPKRFSPEADFSFFTIEAKTPLGTRMEVTGKIADTISEIVEKEIPEKVAYFERWGYGEEAHTFLGWEEASHIALIGVRLKNKTERIRSVFEIVNQLRPKMSDIPGTKIRFSTEDPLQSLLFGGGKPLVLEIYGRDLDSITKYVKRLYPLIEKIPGIYDLEISREIGKPELKIEIDRAKAESMGLTVKSISSSLRMLLQGKDIAEYFYKGKDYDINIRLQEKDRSNIEALSRIFVPLSHDKSIKLTELVKIRLGIGPSKIERKNQERLVKITANIRDIGLNKAVAQIKKKIKEIGLPTNLRISFGGEYEEQKEAFSLMRKATWIALILVYMVMASQFESFIQPLFILISIPFAFIGVVIFMLITKTYFTIDSFLGIIMLVGIVVNNAIVLISYMNLLKKDIPDILDLVINAGKRRLRPIMITTITTIGGLIPLSLQQGEGSEYWKPFSNTIIGGLSFSFLITLFLVPILYYLYYKRNVKS